MKIIARFIDGKLKGYQFAKQERIDTVTGTYPFNIDNDGNEYGWALKWAYHGKDQDPIQNRTVEVIDHKDWDADNYEEYEAPPKITLEDRVIVLESKVETLEAT